MKVQVSELIGPALDWAVATCQGRTVKFDPMGFGPTVPEGGPWIWEEASDKKPCYWRIGGGYSPSTSWTHGGPIIASMKEYCQEKNGDECYCSAPSVAEDWHNHPVKGTGTTPLIAAMRCYVASKLGDIVDIPEELK